MKTKIILAIFLSVLLASCSSLQQSAVNDDLYYSPKDELTAGNDVYANPSFDKNKSTLFDKEYDKKISEVLGDTSKQDLDTTLFHSDKNYENPYESVVVNDYDEAYQRRIDAMSSPYYGMNNNYNIYFSDAYWYASAYMFDPFYNVVIMGDQVWVEPYWMSTSYSYWGRPYYYGYNSYYSPYYSYYSPYYSPYYSYYNPYYYSSPYYNNENYVSSSFNSNRQRSLSSRTMSNSVSGRASRELPENYAGRDITHSSTVKSGIDRQAARPERTGNITTTRPVRSSISPETIRTRESERTNAVNRTTNISRTGTRAVSQDYTRPTSTNRSTYSTSNRTTTRYSRPQSTSIQNTGTPRTSTYSTGRSSNSRSSYTPTSTSTTRSTTTRSTGSSGSYRSSGSSSGSSGSSGRSSGSSTRSSGSSNSSGRGRR